MWDNRLAYLRQFCRWQFQFNFVELKSLYFSFFQGVQLAISQHGPLTRYVKMWVAHAPGMPGTFSPAPRVSGPDMHHGTCVTHVPWCMSGSLTSGFLWSRWRGKRSGHSRRMRNLQFYVSGKRPMGRPGCIPYPIFPGQVKPLVAQVDSGKVLIYFFHTQLWFLVSERDFRQFKSDFQCFWKVITGKNTVKEVESIMGFHTKLSSPSWVCIPQKSFTIARDFWNTNSFGWTQFRMGAHDGFSIFYISPANKMFPKCRALMGSGDDLVPLSRYVITWGICKITMSGYWWP